MTDAAPDAAGSSLESVAAAETSAAALVARLTAVGWTVAVAESLTGGLVVASLVSVPGASATLRGGVVAYATPLKHSLLGVDATLLAAEGAVHPEVARQMAVGVRTTAAVDGAAADVGIATTGVAGPTPQDGKPVGTVYVAVATPTRTDVHALSLTGTRAQIRAEATRRALALGLESVG